MAKNNNETWCRIYKAARIFIAIAAIITTVAIAYGSLDKQVETNCKALEKHGKKIETHDTAITVIQTDLKHIVTGQAAQTTILEDIQKELRNDRRRTPEGP